MLNLEMAERIAKRILPYALIIDSTVDGGEVALFIQYGGWEEMVVTARTRDELIQKLDKLGEL